MALRNFPETLSLHTEFAYLNTSVNENFLAHKVTLLKYYDKDIICNGSHFEEKSLNIINSGTVRVLRSPRGNEKIVAYNLTVGHIFGIENIIYSGNVLPMIVSAIGDVEIYRIHQDDLLGQIEDKNALAGLFGHYIRTMNDVINI